MSTVKIILKTFLICLFVIRMINVSNLEIFTRSTFDDSIGISETGLSFDKVSHSLYSWTPGEMGSFISGGDIGAIIQHKVNDWGLYISGGGVGT